MQFVIEDNQLIQYIDQGQTEITIPKEAEVISEMLFRGNNSLESVNLSEGVKKIGRGAFSDCHRLKSVILPDSLEEIEDGAFLGCHALISLTLPESLTYMSRALPTMVPIHLTRHGRKTTITLKDKDFHLNDSFMAGRDNDYFHSLCVYQEGELREIFDLIKDMDYRIPAAFLLWDLEQDQYYKAFIERNTIRSFRYMMDTHDETHLHFMLDYLSEKNTNSVIKYAHKTNNTEALNIIETYLKEKDNAED